VSARPRTNDNGGTDDTLLAELLLDHAVRGFVEPVRFDGTSSADAEFGDAWREVTT